MTAPRFRSFKNNHREIIYLKLEQQGKKSVSNLPAQSTKVLHGRGQVDTDLNVLYSQIAANKFTSELDMAVIELLMFYGLRISECLRIQPTDIKSNGYIRIKGVKGSKDRLVFPYNNAQYWLTTLKYQCPIGNVYSRFYFYRLFKRLGLYELFSGHKNKSVTHYFRQKLMRSLESENVERTTRSDFIGHKNKKSIEHYESN